ncbi:MAG TPA: DNA repair protein RecO [Candidatus Limnocylindria bacterium]|jgi:DNA repair protein RecO (recombination protein O)|nr:DNA repair protein RecO [Candidatus Limnocylindria bacterium]
MTESTSGLILRTRPLTDTSLIVHWLTPDLGRLATVARGARQPKSAFAGKLDFGFEAGFSFQRSRRSELHALREVSVTDSRGGLRTDYGYLAQAAYAVAFIEQATEAETPLPEVHALMSGFLDHLPQQPPQARSVFAFELKLLSALGLEPEAEDEKLRPGVQSLMAELLVTDWAELVSLKPAADDARALRQFLHGFIIWHCQKLPKGRAEALKAK